MSGALRQPGLACLRSLLVGVPKAGVEAINAPVGCQSSCAGLLRLHHTQRVDDLPTCSSSSSGRGSSASHTMDKSGRCSSFAVSGAHGNTASAVIGARTPAGCFASSSTPLAPLPSHPHATFATIALQLSPGEGLLAARRLRSEPEPFEDEYDDDEYEDGEYVDLDVEDLLADLADVEDIDLDEGEFELSDESDSEGEAEEGEQALPPPPPSARPRKDWRV